VASRGGLAASNKFHASASAIRFSRAEQFVVRADEKLAVFVELESAMRLD
jgi:hypothetical protein